VAIATALTLRTVFGLALRQTEGLIGSIIALLGLDLAVPDHTTLSRRAESFDMVQPRSGSGPVHLLVDSTGLKLCGSGEWLLAKHGTKTPRSWRKLQIAVDADTGQIAAGGADHQRRQRCLAGWAFARSGGWFGCFVQCRRCIRSGRRLWRGRRALSGGVRHRPNSCLQPNPCNNAYSWSRLGVFNRIFAALAAKGGKPDELMIDATYLKARRTAASLLKRGCSPTYRPYQRRLVV
jgi:hypothetical protein